MPTFHFRDDLMFMVHSNIERHGFCIQYVMGEGCAPSWGYSIGFLALGLLLPIFTLASSLGRN